MEVGDDNQPLIDPEVRAFVFSLASALGGSSAGDDGRYVLGDDALAVLKDIKRWLKLYDDKLGRFDVARLLVEANLVKGDLLEILAIWPEDAPEGSFMSKMALLCVDLLTQLTWPIQIDPERATIASYMHVPSLRKAQASYKAAIVNHPAVHMLRTIARVCLPAIAQPREERSAYEGNVIKVVLYFFRNMAMITQPADVAVDEAESGVDRSSTIDEFHYQDIFALILAICSNMHEDYSDHDVEIMDIIFHLVKGVDVENLFMEKQELMSANTKELQQLMGEEKGMLATYARHAPSRHNRFGAMVWIDREAGKRSTLFGQKAAGNEQLSMAEIDNAKKWRKPRRPAKRDAQQQQPQNSFDNGVKLTARARKHLRTFVEQFLDSSFNPLFLAVRRAIEREANRVIPQQHMQQYLYLISWFLKAETARRRKQAADKAKTRNGAGVEVESFALVATVLNQETFVLLNRTMQKALDEKQWQELNAAMKCFTQILLTTQEMSESSLDEDQEIAENILNRIFYEQTTHDRVIALLRSYKDQEFGYLDACTELSHVFLRLLERYSKQNVDMQVRSKRRARKKKRVAQPSNEDAQANEDREVEIEDVADAQRTSSERKFDFHRFAARFINQASVDTYVALLRHYKDLTPERLKRAHRFFYRVAFKMELTVYLFRMDIILLLNKLVRGPEGLNIQNPTFKEWQELVQQVFRRLVKRMEERPALATELLFSKIPSTMFYLEHGYDKEEPKKTFRAAAELEVKPGMEREEQIGVAVSILINQSKSDLLSWIKGVLISAASEREHWEEAHIAIQSVENPERPDSAMPASQSADPNTSADAAATCPKPNNEPTTNPPAQPKAPSIFLHGPTPAHTKSLHGDKHLRLLLTLLRFERLAFDPSATETNWFIPSALTSTQLSADAALIARFEFAPPSYDDGKGAEDLVRRKYVPQTVAVRQPPAHGEDSEGDSDTDIEAALYPAGGPTLAPNMQPKKKKRLLKRQRRTEGSELDAAEVEERRRTRREKEKEKNAKVKSALFVRDSDDESDAERDRMFFEREKSMRERIASGGGNLGYMERLKGQQPVGAKKKKGGKRKQNRARADLDDGVGEMGEDQGGSASESEAMLSGSSPEPATKKRKVSKFQPKAHPPRPAKAKQKRGPFLSDSEGSDVDAAPVSQSSATGPAVSRGFSSATASGNEEDDMMANESEDETDTPPSSQRPSTGRSNAQESPIPKTVTTIDVDGSDKENAPASSPVKAAVPRRSRAMVIDSDSDE